MKLSEILKDKPEGTKSFPLYRAESLEHGKVFAEASMGFQGKVEYGLSGELLTVKASSPRPVLATLGCQLAGWTLGNAMISGPVRMKSKKPSFIYDKLDFGYVPKLPDIACVEGDVSEASIVNELLSNGIESAELILTEENSPSQYINIPARAMEIALFRLSFLGDLNAMKISKSMSTVETRMNKESLNTELNDAIRFNGHVTLAGDFAGFRDFETIVTKNAGLHDQKFETVMRETGCVANCPLELFSVARLTIIDNGKTRVF
jgi:methenyltetrahydromethanopterin cyclohydrolase